MRSIIPLLLAACAATAQTDHTAWRWEQSVPVDAPGLIRLALPPETLGRAQGSLADLRVLSPSGVETPWLAEPSRATKPRELPATGFKATIDGQSTMLTAAPPDGQPIDAIVLDSPAADFLKAARVEAGGADGNWRELSAGEIVFRQGGASRLLLPVPPGSYARIRVAIDDLRTAPVPFTGMRVRLQAAKAQETGHPARIAEQLESHGETRLVIDLGQKNLDLADLRLEIDDALFRRTCRLAYRAEATDGSQTDHALTTGVLYRVQGEDGPAVAETALRVDRQVPSATLVLTIQNGGSPPLAIQGVQARRHPVSLVFHAPQAGGWKLLCGNPRARLPEYDLAALRDALSKAAGTEVVPAPPGERAGFTAPPPMPAIDASGAPIDLAGWAFRRPLPVGGPGVIRVEVDAGTLARCRSDLADLRLIQDGKQLPFLVVSVAQSRAIVPDVAMDPDPKRPSVSRWKLTLPVAGLPAAKLTATSPATLFDRTFVARAAREDQLGNPWLETLGTARWTKSPDGARDHATLSVGLAQARLPATFTLETDNGDNPPVTLESISVHHAAPILAAKFPGGSPLFLYYGNAQAAPPRYDLGLARAELLAEDKQAVSPGAEQALGPGSSRTGAVSGAGSPWLWAAMAVVVVVLLLVVARLLPGKHDGPAEDA